MLGRERECSTDNFRYRSKVRRNKHSNFVTADYVTSRSFAHSMKTCVTMLMQRYVKGWVSQDML